MNKNQITIDIKPTIPQALVTVPKVAESAKVTEKSTTPAIQMLVYGSAGIGKTSFANCINDTYFLDLENGCIGVPSKRKKAFPIIGYNSVSQASVQTLNTFLDQMLKSKTELPFKVLVVDSLTRLDEFAEQEVVAEEKLRSKTPDKVLTIGDLPYGAGYSMARDKVMKIVHKCFAISIQKNVDLVMIAHSKDKQVKKVGMLPYDTVCPRLSKGALASIVELVPFSFYLGKKITDDGVVIERGLFTEPDMTCENVKRRVKFSQGVYDLGDGEKGSKTFFAELYAKWCAANE